MAHQKSYMYADRDLISIFLVCLVLPVEPYFPKNVWLERSFSSVTSREYSPH